MTKRVSGQTQGDLRDAAEKWLRNNDPEYAPRNWVTPSVDALPRALHPTNAPHPSLDDIYEVVPKGEGNYRRRSHLTDDGSGVRIEFWFDDLPAALIQADITEPSAEAAVTFSMKNEYRSSNGYVEAKARADEQNAAQARSAVLCAQVNTPPWAEDLNEEDE